MVEPEDNELAEDDKGEELVVVGETVEDTPLEFVVIEEAVVDELGEDD